MTVATSTEKQINYIREHYGFLAGFLNIPEIRSILLRAGSLAQQGKPISAEVLRGQVYATKWWKTTADVTRSWTALSATDPAEAKKRIENTMREIRTMATGMGLPMDQKQLLAYATQVNKYGWSEQQVKDGIASHLVYNSQKAQQGQAALAVDSVKEMAAKYLVPLSDATIQKWGRDLVSGNVDPAAFESYAKEQAKSLFPGLTAAIDAGVTVADYIEPYKQIAAQTLEIPEEQVNWMDPKWRKAVDQIDPKTGVRASMSLSDWQRTLRTDTVYGYDKTQQARNEAADLTTKLATLFGA